MKWFKFYGEEYLADPKMLLMTPAERSCWVTLLCFASQHNGEVKHLTEDNLMERAGVNLKKSDAKVTRGVLQKFARLQMVKLSSDGTVTLVHWRKRQNSFMSGAERMKRHRALRKSDEESDANVTLDKSSRYIRNARLDAAAKIPEKIHLLTQKNKEIQTKFQETKDGIVKKWRV